jgi:hypothetical protein
MALSLSQLTTPLTRAEVESAIYAALAAKGVSTTSWKPGAVVRTLIFGVSVVLSAASSLQARIAESGFLALATGDWLTAVALYVYGVERDLGAFATGEVVLTNNAGGVYAGGIGDLVVQNPTSKKTYRNTAPYALGAGPGTELVVPVQADELGTASTSTPDTITSLVTTLIAVDVTNPTAIVGRDPETDQELRVRCLAKTGTLSPNGPKDAYTFVALSALRADGTAIGVTRVRVIADGEGNVTVYLGTASGAIPGTAGDPGTDLGAVQLAIDELCEPLAVTATAVGATPKEIAVTWELWLHDTVGQSQAQIEAAVALALTRYVTTSPIGGFVVSPDVVGKIFKEKIDSVVGGVFADHTIKLAVTLPAGDTTLAVNELPVIGTITPAGVHFVSGGQIT